MELHVTNVNQGLAAALCYLTVAGKRENSRNGPVLVAPEPVMTVYSAPWQRVLFSPLRDANPFFHFFEALWMIAGGNDLAWPLQFNKRFVEYSDDGNILHGTYGYRWRWAFGFDQLYVLVKELKSNPETRRGVLAMWDATVERNDDLRYAVTPGSKDAPCNTHVYFDARDGRLNMTVCCRSNDIWWGAYGANAVHFSMLQEYLAIQVGVPIGVYRQFSNNFHLYTEVVTGQLNSLALNAETHDEYLNRSLTYYPLFRPGEQDWWDKELRLFLERPMLNRYQHPFFTSVARPMYMAWNARKVKVNVEEQLTYAYRILAPDWRLACIDWIKRKEVQRAARAVASANFPRPE